MITAYSTRELPDAIQDLEAQYSGGEPSLVIFFASTRYNPEELSRQMRAAFPRACVAGCSTAGEIACGKMRSGSIGAVFLDHDTVVRVAPAVIENIGGRVSLDQGFSAMERSLQSPLSSLDLEKYVGLVLADGMSGAEEELMERIGDRTDLYFIGGSAGDDLKFLRTHVWVDGRCYTDAALLLLLEVKRGFDILKTQSFLPTGKSLVATRVDTARRCVHEFDGKPALKAYGEALGVPAEQVPPLFVRHPLGLMVDGEPFVRSPRCAEGSAICFYCQIKEGMELELLDASDIVAGTRKAIETRKATGAPISGILEFQCILRTLQLRAENRCDEYSSTFSGIPAAGFSTYGEAYLGHMNQTSTMLVLH